jgi:hypothetical protein
MIHLRLFSLILIHIFGIVYGALSCERGMITGVFEDSKQKPIPGALIALYDSKTNRFIESSYSLDNGKFVFSPIQHDGDLFLVATTTTESKRSETFSYNRDSCGIDKRIIGKSRQSSWLSYFTEYIKWAVSTLLGYGVAMLQNLIKQKRMAKKYIVRYKKRLKKMVEHTVASKLQIIKILGDYVNDNNFDAFKNQFTLIVDELDRSISMIEEILNEESFDENIDILRKGETSLATARSALSNIFKEIRSSILSIDPSKFAGATKDEREYVMGPFQKLDEAILQNTLLI